MAGDFCVFICAVPTRTVIVAPPTLAEKSAKSQAAGLSGWNGRRPSNRSRRTLCCQPAKLGLLCAAGYGSIYRKVNA